MGPVENSIDGTFVNMDADRDGEGDFDRLDVVLVLIVRDGTVDGFSEGFIGSKDLC